MADEGNNRLRVLDLNTNQTSSICSGERGHKDGNLLFCSLAEPYSLMLHEGEIYVRKQAHKKNKRFVIYIFIEAWLQERYYPFDYTTFLTVFDSGVLGRKKHSF